MAHAKGLLLVCLMVGTARPLWGQDLDSSGGLTELDAAAQQRLLDLAGPGYRLRQTEHFAIAYDTPEDTLRALISRVEATYSSVYRFCKINEIPAEQPAEHLQVLFFHEYDAYGRYAASARFNHVGSAGFYNQRNNVAAFVNVLNLPELGPVNRQIESSERKMERLKAARPVNREALRSERRTLTRLVNQRDRFVEQTNRVAVQHEAAHQVLFNAGVHVFGAQNPGWLVEGLGCLFETAPSSAGAGVGATNQTRLADFRQLLGGGNPSGRIKVVDLQVALASGKFLPLRELVGDARAFSRRDNPNLVHYYTQGWSLVCYLQRKKRQEFAEYLRLLSHRKFGEPTTPAQEIADFERVFGELDERFERRWVSFVLGLRFKPSALGG
ncbi:MAG: DUF1570 domain-containing protein [Planctomycetota bacterium]|jgi:hypothetical protein